MSLLRNGMWAAVLMVCSLGTASCDDTVPTTTSEEVRSTIERELTVGATADEIERFFTQHEISYVWDEINGAYAAIIREVAPFHAIRIWVFVDAERRFVRAEVHDSYTAP